MKKDINKAFDTYIFECRTVNRLRPATIRGYVHAFKNFRQLMPRVEKVEDITWQVMVEFFDRLNNRERTVGKGTKKTGVKTSTISTYWSKLNSFFEWLEQNNPELRNPLRENKKKKPLPNYDDKKELTRKDFEKIVSTITLRYQNKLLLRRDLALIYTLFCCGLRKGEILGLQVRDIDLDKRVITVRAETSKSKRNRQIPINGTLVLHLEDYLVERRRKGYKTEAFFVSSNQDKGLTEHGLKHWIKKLKELSGLEELHLHMLRHTFACNLARGNIRPYNLQKLMGHTDMRMTERYLRSMTVEDFREDVERISIDNMA